MEKLFAGKIFADHYQFYILDGGLDPDEWPIDWDPESTRLGYISNGRAIAISTVADLNSHWLEVYISNECPILENCERALVFNISIVSGELEIRSPMYEEACLGIVPMDYIVYIIGYSLGLEQEEELCDYELQGRMDLERYKVILVAGQTENEGVIKGGKYLPR